MDSRASKILETISKFAHPESDPPFTGQDQSSLHWGVAVSYLDDRRCSLNEQDLAERSGYSLWWSCVRFTFRSIAAKRARLRWRTLIDVAEDRTSFHVTPAPATIYFELLTRPPIKVMATAVRRRASTPCEVSEIESEFLDPDQLVGKAGRGRSL